MARIRSIKPEFFTSLTIAGLDLPARLTFIGLWTHADDQGRCLDNARLIRAAVWPLDDRSVADVEDDLRALTEASLIAQYTVGGRRYIAIRGWSEHQRINRPTESPIPAPSEAPEPPPTSGNEDSLSPHAQLSEDSLLEGKGREGKGREGKGRNTSSPPLRDVDGAFARFWLAYPRKVGKADAAKAWKAAAQRADPGAIVEAAQRVAADPNLPDEQYIPHGATWLRRNGWDDPPYPDRRPKPEPRTSTTDQRVAAGLALAAKYDAEDSGQVTPLRAIEGAS